MSMRLFCAIFNHCERPGKKSHLKSHNLPFEVPCQKLSLASALQKILIFKK